MGKNGDGLTKLGPGRWRARITVRDRATGKKALDTTRVIVADTKLEALQKRAQLVADIAGTGDEWTVDEALAAWMPTLRGGTLHARRTHQKRISAAFGKLRLSRVQTADVQRWLAALKCGDDTANYHRATLQALYAFARRQGRLQGANPIEQTQPRSTPKTSAQLLAELEQPQKPRAILGDGLARFFAALETLHPEIYPLLKTQLLLGCRWAECTVLQWGDIDWQTGVVTIRRSQSRKGELGPPKGKRARVAALGPDGLAFLRGHRAEMERLAWPGADLWMFPRPPFKKPRPCDVWGYETTRRYVHDALRVAGLEVAAVTHAMRHTFVTLSRALESDAAMRASVGHSDERLTERYTDDSHRAAVAQALAGQMESRLGGVAPGVAPVIRIAKSFKKTR